MSEQRLIQNLIALVMCALIAFPWLSDEFYLDFVTHLMILSIFAMSLDLLVGYTGLVSLGHAAFYGISGYAVAIFTPYHEVPSIFWLLPISIGVTSITALIIGWISIRTSGVYFIMITLAFAQMFYYFFNDFSAFGGSDGLFVMHRPNFGFNDYQLIDLENNVVFYYFVLIMLSSGYLFLQRILKAPFGLVLRGIKADEQRIRSLGYNTKTYKLISFVLAASFAGLAGFLQATHSGIVSPAHLSWHESGFILITVILGGMGTLYGPIIGAFVLGIIQDQLQILSEHWMLYLGFLIIVIVLIMPRGIAGAMKHLTSLYFRKNN